MARAKQAIATEGGLYQRDFRLWVEEQARLLRGSEFERLDIANLVEEIEDLGVAAKKAVKSNLVVVLLHLLKHQFQPRRRSRSWQASILEHRQRLRDDLRTSPSLRGHAQDVFDEAYADARARARAETGLPERKLPPEPPYSLEQTLDPDFLPD
ncbi:MAG: hypothetical protein K0S96_1144 [Geminicoccaceae bacterium]|jgi:hypothetical protein|nr:hypothetical protein [Geminicoccaceae bacterium]MDF2781340.1 hypothetical protein [Geminicoccaceae bacterium]